MATRLVSDGYYVAVLAREHGPGTRAKSIVRVAQFLRRWLSRRFGHWQPEYRVYRVRNVADAMNELIDRDGFDCAILQFDGPHRKIDFNESAANRYAVYIRDIRHVHDMSPESFPASIPLIANSDFTARAVAEKTGRPVFTIIPYVEKRCYSTIARGPFVTFINPVTEKGVDLAISIATACPELPFLFVESWPLSKSAWHELDRRIKRVPNIEIRRRVLDMCTIYRQTRILLVPSQWEESWGRVVTEGHFSAIPVLASDIGGLAESVGRGGLLIAPSDPPQKWVAALRELYSPKQHARFSIRASEQAEAYWSRAQGIPRALLECCFGLRESP